MQLDPKTPPDLDEGTRTRSLSPRRPAGGPARRPGRCLACDGAPLVAGQVLVLAAANALCRQHEAMAMEYARRASRFPGAAGETARAVLSAFGDAPESGSPWAPDTSGPRPRQDAPGHRVAARC